MLDNLAQKQTLEGLQAGVRVLEQQTSGYDGGSNVHTDPTQQTGCSDNTLDEGISKASRIIAQTGPSRRLHSARHRSALHLPLCLNLVPVRVQSHVHLTPASQGCREAVSCMHQTACFVISTVLSSSC